MKESNSMNSGLRVLSEIEMRSEEVIGCLQDLIKIDSVTGKEGSIQDYLSQHLSSIGLDVVTFEPDVESLRQEIGFVEPEKSFDGRPNLVGIWRGSGGGRSLVLNGHVDTVPFEPIIDWRYHPLSAEIADDRVWGRGASDMKGGLAAMLMAVHLLKGAGYKPRGDVILLLVVDEERTGLGTLACVQKGYVADAGICCETSDLQVMPACIGRMWFSIYVKGRTVGISERWKGESAISKSIKIIKAIDELEDIRVMDLTHPLYPDNRGALPCMATMIEAGSFPSIVPDSAVIRGSMGLMPYEEISEALDQLRKQIHYVSQADPWLRMHEPEISIGDGYVAAGAEIPVDHPIVKTVCDGFRQAAGEEPKLGGRMGAADTRFLIRNGDTPTVIFGPGVTAQMHATNENVPIKDVIIATKTLALSIMEWCG